MDKIEGCIISENTGGVYKYNGFPLFKDGSYIINATKVDRPSKKLTKEEQEELTNHILEMHTITVSCFTNTD